MPEQYYSGEAPGFAHMLFGFGLFGVADYMDRAGGMAQKISWNPKMITGYRSLVPHGPGILRPPPGSGGHTLIPRIGNNPYHYKNFKRPGFFQDPFSRISDTAKAGQELTAVRQFRWDTAEELISNFRGGGWGFAKKKFDERMVQYGTKAGGWTMAKMGLGMLGRGASIYFNAAFLADIVTGVSGSAIDSLIEIGRPKDTRSRMYDTPAIATMRKAGLVAIAQSQMNTRSAFGREASYMHT